MVMPHSMLLNNSRSALPFYSSPVSYQRGSGLGGLLRGLFRSVRPLLQRPIVKRGLKALGKAATAAVLEAGQHAMAQDNIHAFGPALKEAGRRQARQLIRTMTGGSKRKRKPRGKLSHSRTSVKRRRVAVVHGQNKKSKLGPISRDIFHP
jgi:hypothetical protein